MQEALFDNMAIISDKIGVSDRIPTTISSVVLEWAGLVHNCNSSLVLDRSKFRRARKNARLEVQENMELLKP